MIQELTIKGFKSFFDETLRIAPLTILTGLNSSGKSSVMQALRMIKQHFNGGDILLEGHGTEEELRNPYYGGAFSIDAEYTTMDGESLYAGYGPEARTSDGMVQFPDVIYISADRFGPRRSIPVEKGYHLGSRGDNVLKCIDHYESTELNPLLFHEKSEGDTFGFNLRAWLGAISPGIKFQHEMVRVTDSSYTLFDGHRALNVGFGLSYTLPIIVALFIGTIEPNTIVLIENPEAHLHPKGQTEMGRLIGLAVEAGAQVVVETHSDHLFDGVRIYAKHHTGFAGKVATHWFELDNDRLTRVESPEMSDDGNLREWPKGMFDQFGINATELLKK